jgi:hypothetical protein
MLAFFRQKRRFRIQQGVGAFMCVAALVYLLTPQSTIYHWVEVTYNFVYLPHMTVIGLVTCGWLLMASRHTHWIVYLLLTLPVIFHPLINSWYVLVKGNGSLLPAFEIIAFWVLLQVVYAQQEEILWMHRPINS